MRIYHDSRENALRTKWRTWPESEGRATLCLSHNRWLSFRLPNSLPSETPQSISSVICLHSTGNSDEIERDPSQASPAISTQQLIPGCLT